MIWRPQREILLWGLLLNFPNPALPNARERIEIWKNAACVIADWYLSNGQTELKQNHQAGLLTEAGAIQRWERRTLQRGKGRRVVSLDWWTQPPPRVRDRLIEKETRP